jgi:hypothetical protein
MAVGTSPVDVVENQWVRTILSYSCLVVQPMA